MSESAINAACMILIFFLFINPSSSNISAKSNPDITDRFESLLMLEFNPVIEFQNVVPIRNLETSSPYSYSSDDSFLSDDSYLFDDSYSYVYDDLDSQIDFEDTSFSFSFSYSYELESDIFIESDILNGTEIVDSGLICDADSGETSWMADIIEQMAAVVLGLDLVTTMDELADFCLSSDSYYAVVAPQVNVSQDISYDTNSVLSCGWDLLIDQWCENVTVNTTWPVAGECADEFALFTLDPESSCDIIYTPESFSDTDFCDIETFYSTLLQNLTVVQSEACLQDSLLMSLADCIFTNSDRCPSTGTSTCEQPSVTSAVLNSYGTAFTLTFLSDTNKGGKGCAEFTCSELLRFDDANSTTCIWLDERELHVGASSRVSVSPGESITVLGDITSAQCFNSTMNETHQEVVAPTIQFAPVVSFGPMSEIYGTCTNVSLTGAGSIVGGIPEFSWSLVSSSASSTGLLSSFLSSKNSDDVTIPSSYLESGNWYAVQLTASNCFGLSGSALANFTISDETFPSLLILPSISIYAYNSLTLEAKGSVSTCGETSCSSSLSYSWSVVGHPEVAFSNYGNAFSLDGGVLNSSTTYYIKCTVTDCHNRNNSATVTVTTYETALVPFISGGSSREVTEEWSFELDGSSSYDPDGHPLTYWWSCIDATGSDCDLDLSSTSSVVSFGSAALLHDSSREPYTVTLTVTSTKDDRNASIQQEIYVSTEEIPHIYVGTTVHASISDDQINAFTGYIDTTEGDVSATWVLGIDSHELVCGLSVADYSLSTSVKSFDHNSYSGLAPFKISFPSGALSDYTSEYTLRLKASFDGSDDYGFAEIHFESNDLPSAGEISVSPYSGTYLVTLFNAAMKSWVDGDLPLKYSYYQYTSGSTSTQTLVQAEDYSHIATGFYLPEGSIIVVGYVEDVLGAVASAESSSITVTQDDSMSLMNTTKLAKSIISTALDEGDYDTISSTIVSLTSSLTWSTDCSGAPDCAALKRENCSDTANTCGECMDGYSGYSGDANSYCVDASSCQVNGVQDGTETDVDCGGSSCEVCSTGDSCTQDSDCEWNICENDVCQESIQDAPMYNGVECNDQGSAVYTDKFTDEDMAESWCVQSQILCHTSCECNDGYNGKACQYTDAEASAAASAYAVAFEESQSVISELGSSISSSNLETYSSILSDSCEDMDLLTDSLRSSGLTFLDSLLSTSASMTSTAAAEILSTISSYTAYQSTVSRRRRRNLADRVLLDSTDTTLLAQTIKMCEELLVDSEEGYSTDLVEDEVTLTYGNYYGADLCFLLEQAQTTDQASSGLTPMGVKLCDGFEDGTSYDVCTVETISTDMGSSTISYLYKTQIQEADSSSRRRRQRRLIDTTSNYIKIGFYSSIEWETESNYTAQGSCDGSIYHNASQCGNSGVYITCPTDAEYYSLTCVSNSTYPQCFMYNNATDAWDTSCQTLNYTSMEVICDCGTSSGLFRAQTELKIGEVYVKYSTPTNAPTASPTSSPTLTAYPTLTPTLSPTASPTKTPTSSPTTSPTKTPTSSPTLTTSPTNTPTSSPTASPTKTPTSSPTLTAYPTITPTSSPTTSPTKTPTSSPTASPTITPTSSPTISPTKTPTSSPTTSPTETPTSAPTTTTLTSAPTTTGLEVIIVQNPVSPAPSTLFNWNVYILVVLPLGVATSLLF